MEKHDTNTSRHSATRFQNLLEFFPAGVIIVDNSHRILIVNRQFEKMFGYDRAEIIGRSAEIFLAQRFVRHFDSNGEPHLNPERVPPLHHSGESFVCHKDGSQFPVDIHIGRMETADGIEFIATIRDISEQKRIEVQLEYHANHDGLTGLPNRNLLEDRIGQALLHAERFQQPVAILFIDLDHFKFFLAGLSHEMGDTVIQKTAERLKACVRENDTVARLGDDVFVIVLSDQKRSEDAAKVAEKVRARVNRPIMLGFRACEISCSIGIGIYPKDGKDVRTLLKNAEVAMFRAKEKGRGCFHFFTEQLNDRIAVRITMERCLGKAVANKEFSLHYQPQMDLRTGRMIGCEALLRWQNPDLGEVLPDRFIPLAEETGLIIPIGKWVLETACTDNKRRQKDGHPPLPVAVNLSPRQFWDPGLVATIARVLQDTGLESRYLELEITEGMVMRDVDGALAMLRDLKELGVVLSIDDFGTGYSNLSHLKRFPFDKLKMDITFVQEVTHDPGCASIAKSIIAMAHNLNLRVIAEGIETEGQLNYLRQRGCDEMQGFYFSKPLNNRDFEQLLIEGRSLQVPEYDEGRPGRTLLLIDDEPNIISSLTRVLSDDGYRILSTTKADDGFELLATNRIGVVLSDLRMPGMDGIEFLSRVSRIHPETVRMAMSGYADAGMITEAINRGAVYKFLTKPIGNESLRQNIVKAFEYFEISIHQEQ
jgi:diguanylate cyclase (GGDEF)-like protein/PAS domain S-box-containing protein